MSVCIALLISLVSLLSESDEIEIVFAGDAMQHQSQLDAALRSGEGKRYDYSGYFDDIAPLIKSADYAVVNLECPLGGKNYSGYPMFCAPDAYAEALKDAGFNLALTANNHILDRGAKGVVRTIAVLDSIGFEHIGTYSDVSLRESKCPFIRCIKGFNVAFLNYTYSLNGIPCPPTVGIDILDTELIKADISKARKSGAEIVIVCPHWGNEYKLVPEQFQRNMADSFLAYGADIVMGSHPHVIQPMEFHSDSTGSSLTVYSLGNFISGMLTTDTRGGALCTVTIKRDSVGKPYLADANYRLVFTQRPIEGKSSNYRVVPAEIPIDNPVINEQRKMFVKNAERIFTLYNKNVNRDTVSIPAVVRRRLSKIPISIRKADD